jgi:hypothetical protein
VTIPPPRSRRRGRFALLPVCGLLLGLAGCAASTADTDAGPVFCQEPAHRADLTTAAVTLGLASGSGDGTVVVGGRTLSTQRWQRADPAGFGRACAAVRAADGAPAPSSGAGAALLSVISVLLPLVAGAVLGLLTSAYRDAVLARRELATQLARAAREFTETGLEYVNTWRSPARQGDPAPVRQRRWRLAEVLEDVTQRHPGWTPATDRITALLTGPFGEPLLTGWAEQDGAARRDRAEALPWTELTTAVTPVVAALRRPAWLRRRPAGAAP